MEPFRGVLNILACVVVWTLIVVVTAGFGLVALAAWAYLVFADTSRRGVIALDKLQQTLMPNETLLVAAVQLRPFAFWSRRQSIGISNSRIIIVARGLLGGFTMRDIQWKDLQDAEMSENVLPATCGSSLSFAYRKGDFGSVSRRRDNAAGLGLPSMFIGGVPSDEARSIYSQSQSQEQAWEEKRRIRAIEETRAAAGGVFVNTAQAEAAPAKPAGSIVEQLNGLKQLLDSGVISDAEFNEMKAKIIAAH